jgi:hypothetical protein
MSEPTYAAASNNSRALELLEKLEAMGDLRPEEASTLEQLRASAPADSAAMGETQAMYRGAAQGVTLGFGDELLAASSGMGNMLTGGAIGSPYQESLDGTRGRNRAAQEAFPGAYSGGEVVGGGLASLLPMGAAMKGMQGARLGTQMLAGGATGAGAAALGGFARGEGDTVMEGLANRTDKALEPGPLIAGGGIGALAPLAATGIGRVVGNAAAPAGRAVSDLGYTRGAARAASRSFQRDAQANPEIEQYLRDLGPDAMPLDAGINTQAVGGAVAGNPGQGAARLQQALSGRDKATPDRLSRAMDDVGGPVENRALAERVREMSRNRDASPLYESAKAIPTPLDVSASLERIESTIADRAAGYSSLRGIATDLAEDSRPIVVHNIRVRLSDEARAAEIAGKAGEAATLRAVMRDLDEQLDTLPGYKDARKIWADSKALDDAAEDGANFLKRGSRADDLGLRWASDLSEPEKDAFRTAAREALDFEMANGVREGGAGINLINKRANQEKIDLIFGEGSAAKLKKQADAETAFKGTKQAVIGGSPTAPRIQAQKEIAPMVDADGVRMGVMQRAKNVLYQPINEAVDAIVGLPSGKSLDDIARMLTTQGPEAQAVVKALMDSQTGAARNSAISGNTKRILEALIQSGGAGFTMAR